MRPCNFLFLALIVKLIIVYIILASININLTYVFICLFKFKFNFNNNYLNLPTNIVQYLMISNKYFQFVFEYQYYFTHLD